MANAASPFVSKKCKNCNFEYKNKKDYLLNGQHFRVCISQNLWFECICGSTLLLKKGDFDWYSPKMFMGAEAVKIYDQFSVLQKIPNLPSGVMLLQQKIRDPEASVQEIAQTMRSTPVLAAEVLAMATSMSHMGQKISSIEHAITYLGRSFVSHLVLAATLKSFKFQTGQFLPANFWGEAFLTGLITERVQELYGEAKKEGDLSYLAGTLCNIGKFVGAVCFPQKTDRIHGIISNPKTQTTWRKAEEQLKGVDHTLLGEIALAYWGIPEELKDAIVMHHQGVQKDTKDSLAKLALSEAVAFACQLTHWVRLEPHRIEESLLKEFTSYLGLSTQELNDLAATLAPLKDRVEVQVRSFADGPRPATPF